MSFPKPFDSRQVKNSPELENLGSLADALLKDILTELNAHFSQLRIQPLSPNSDRVLITGANITKTLGFQVGQITKNLLISFDGAEIDFTTGIVYESDGITPTVDSFTPFVLAADEYIYYAVTLKPYTVQADNTIGLKISIKPASSSNLVLASAPKAKFASGIQIGQVWIKMDNSGLNLEDIGWDNIIQVGAGSGSGGGGNTSENTITNNQVAPANITDLLFDSAEVRGVKVEYVITRQTATDYKREIGSIKFVYDENLAAWYDVAPEYSLHDSGVTFSIDSSGQVKYTSTNLSGASYTGRIDFNIIIEL